jgi:hypothetical protein
VTTSPRSEGEALKAIVRRNTDQVQGQGDFALFDELFADDFVDHTPQPGTTPDKAGVRVLYNRLRDAFPDFRPEIHWQTVDGDIVTAYKIYHGTHRGDFLGVAPTGSGALPARRADFKSRIGRPDGHKSPEELGAAAIFVADAAQCRCVTRDTCPLWTE